MCGCTGDLISDTFQVHESMMGVAEEIWFCLVALL